MTNATKADGKPFEIWVVVNEVLASDQEDLFYSRYLSHKYHVSRNYHQCRCENSTSANIKVSTGTIHGQAATLIISMKQKSEMNLT
jgi:hypothetical protein